MQDTALDITKSLMQARWVLPAVNQDEVVRLARLHDLPEIIARLLVARGVAPEEVEAFLDPKLARDFPDPFSLQGMEALAVFLAGAIAAGRRIGIFGDFDVDGATSTAIMLRFLRHLGMEAAFYIPDRLEEGYGPNTGALQKLMEQGCEIVILCDCGITAHDVVAEGNALGLEIVILDHHEAEDKLPPAAHVIDPKRKDDSSGLDMLAACGVAFLTCVAANAKLREKGFYAERGLSEPPLKSWLDIVALGTVADMVPLKGANRLFVRQGLLQMADSDNPGIRALLEVSRIKEAPTPYDIGFALGPRINAGSRVHKSDLGARLLATENPEEAQQIAWELEDCNKKRREIQSEMFSHAVNLVEEQRLQDKPVIVVGHEDWHPGLSGLVAGRLKEKYEKPAVCITYAPGENGELEGRGSGRSVQGVNMGAAFIEGRNQGLLLKGGGHAMAAGFTVLPSKIKELEDFLTANIEAQLAGQVAVTELMLDGILSARGATVEFVRLIQERFGPFGQEHPEPLFALPNVRLHMVDVVGTDHVRCQLSDWEGGSRIKAIAFRSAGTPLGDTLLKAGRDRPFHIVGHFKINSWQGRESAEIHITDAALAIAVRDEHQSIAAAE